MGAAAIGRGCALSVGGKRHLHRRTVFQKHCARNFLTHEMVAAFVVAFGRVPDWPCPSRPSASERFHVTELVSAWGSLRSANRQRLSAGVYEPDIERMQVLAKSLWHYWPAALIHVLVNGFDWQGTAAPLAPSCNGAAQSFFPCATRIPRGNKKPRSAPSSTSFRPCGCIGSSPCLKSAIEAANERGFDQTKEKYHG